MRKVLQDFPRSSVSKESSSNAGDPGLIPGLERFPGEGNGNPLQYSSILAWRIPWTEEPGRLQSIGLQESDRTQLNHHHLQPMKTRFTNSKILHIQLSSSKLVKQSKTHTHTETHTKSTGGSSRATGSSTHKPSTGSSHCACGRSSHDHRIIMLCAVCKFQKQHRREALDYCGLTCIHIFL